MLEWALEPEFVCRNTIDGDPRPYFASWGAIATLMGEMGNIRGICLMAGDSSP
jgi:hypothetical protein